MVGALQERELSKRLKRGYVGLSGLGEELPSPSKLGSFPHLSKPGYCGWGYHPAADAYLGVFRAGVSGG